MGNKTLDAFLQKQMRNIHDDAALESFGGGKKSRKPKPAKYKNVTSSSQLFQMSTRGTAVVTRGQLYVVEQGEITSITKDVIVSMGFGNHPNFGKCVRACWNAHVKAGAHMERLARGKVSKIRQRELDQIRKSPQFLAAMRGTYRAFIILNYTQAESSKKKEGKLKQLLIKAFKDNFEDDKNKVDGQTVALKFGGSQKDPVTGELLGSQLGHGDYGQSVVGMRAQKFKDAVIRDKNLSTEDKERLLQMTMAPELEPLKISLDHETVFTTNGKFKKEYALILSVQSAKANIKDKDTEKEAFQFFKKNVEKEQLVAQESSTPIIEMVRQSVLASLTKSKFVKGKSERLKESFREKSGASRDTKVRMGPSLNENIIVAGRGSFSDINTSDIRPKKEHKRRKNISPIQLLKQINARLPEKVAGNMEPPALENRTGRFAASVRAVNIDRTAKGFPSVSYTYEKNPYQVYETSAGKRPWSSLERDPRTLVDRSIREIAIELQLGRFYTRRV